MNQVLRYAFSCITLIPNTVFEDMIDEVTNFTMNSVIVLCKRDDIILFIDTN